MIFNRNGYPKPTGATDWMDSCHAISLMAFVNYPGLDKDLLFDYFNDETGEVVRCPKDFTGLCPSNPKNFTRDQLIPFCAATPTPFLVFDAVRKRGYRAQNTEKDIPGSTKKFPDGADILDPSHIGYMKICAGLKANWFEKLWMKARIKISSKFSPMKEPNNIIVMSVAYGYVDYLYQCNPKIEDAVRLYWNGWRNEPELAEMIIQKLRGSRK